MILEGITNSFLYSPSKITFSQQHAHFHPNNLKPCNMEKGRMDIGHFFLSPWKPEPHEGLVVLVIPSAVFDSPAAHFTCQRYRDAACRPSDSTPVLHLLLRDVVVDRKTEIYHQQKVRYIGTFSQLFFRFLEFF